MKESNNNDMISVRVKGGSVFENDEFKEYYAYSKFSQLFSTQEVRQRMGDKIVDCIIKFSKRINEDEVIDLDYFIAKFLILFESGEMHQEIDDETLDSILKYLEEINKDEDNPVRTFMELIRPPLNNNNVNHNVDAVATSEVEEEEEVIEIERGQELVVQQPQTTYIIGNPEFIRLLLQQRHIDEIQDYSPMNRLSEIDIANIIRMAQDWYEQNNNAARNDVPMILDVPYVNDNPLIPMQWPDFEVNNPEVLPESGFFPNWNDIFGNFNGNVMAALLVVGMLFYLNNQNLNNDLCG